MEKSSSDNLSGSDRALPRRSSRIGRSETLLNIKRSMKLKAEQSELQTGFVKDDFEVAQNAKDKVKLDTGVVYDEEMVKHYCFWDQNYPENPDRFTGILKRCTELGLLNRCKRIPSRRATKEEILLLHSPELLDVMDDSCNEDNYEVLEEMSSKFDSIYLNKDTYKCATLAAGSSIELVDAICKNQIQNGMAIVRPPGHHAMRSEFCGYCFFNNAALAATHAIKNLGLNRILIVDWDVHHGQGTQQMFYDDPRVIYFSIHRYQHGAFWPELRESNFDYIGEKSGKGFNFNVPLNATGLCDADYLAIFHQILIPVAYEYEPELVIVCAGYDAALGCPEGEMNLTPAVFAHLLNPLMALASGKVAVILEGGYCIKSLSEAAALTLRGLLGDPAPRLFDYGSPSESVVTSILNVISMQKPHWSSLTIQETYPAIGSVPGKSKKGNEKEMGIFPPERKHIPSIRFEGTVKEKPTVYATREFYPPRLPILEGKFDRKLDQLKSMTDLFVPPKRVVLAYHEAMTEHRSMIRPHHPEKPERINSIYKRHEEYGLLDRCTLIQPRMARKEELMLIHDEGYVNEIEKIAQLSEEELFRQSSSYESVYLHPKTYDCALLSAGCVLQVVDEVLLHRSRAGVAIVRPPGHHAEANAACGFCIFNNASLAAKYAIERHNLKRILLVDWDVHHGNGSQRIFESDNRVLYISLHRYNNAKFFPSSTDANYDKCGGGKGKGFNVNIPWNSPGVEVTDGDYVAAFHYIVMPIAYQYDPELVVISGGFDACINDPLGSCKVTPEAFAHMTHWLTALANGKIVLCLEGGYNVVSISYAMTLCTKALLGDPLPPLTMNLQASQSAVETIRNVAMVHEKFWPCLRFNRILPEDIVLEVKPPKTESEANVEESNPQAKDASEPAEGEQAATDPLADKMKVLEIDPEFSNLDSKSSNVDSKPSNLDSELSNLDSKPSNLNSEPSNLDSKPSNMDSKPSNLESEPSNLDSKPSNLDSELSNLDSKPSNLDSKPSNLDCEPSNLDSKPSNLDSQPMNLDSEPSNVDSQPSNFDSNYKPQDANENIRRNNASGPPVRDADSENATGQADRPTLVEYLSENMQRLLNEEMYAVIPQSGCPHLVEVQAVPQSGISVETPCSDCETTQENWICLICYSVHCGRYVSQHMVAHNEESGHPLTLSFTDLSVWCYVCEAYIDNMVLYPAKNAVHRSKFGSDLQWSYGEENQLQAESA